MVNDTEPHNPPSSEGHPHEGGVELLGQKISKRTPVRESMEVSVAHSGDIGPAAPPGMAQ